MKENRYGSHTVTRLTAHLIWATKYRYHVLKGDVQLRWRELLIQICDAEDVRILKGVVSKDHVHMHIEYSPVEGTLRPSQKMQRAYLTHPATGVPGVAEKILGATLLGHRVRSVEHGQHHRRDGARIS